MKRREFTLLGGVAARGARAAGGETAHHRVACWPAHQREVEGDDRQRISGHGPHWSSRVLAKRPARARETHWHLLESTGVAWFHPHKYNLFSDRKPA
jgi:hypothetical protein